jgi:hypothetical protein
VVVKQQPDDAKWDAGDIEHNVLRWTSSVNPPFGGYGPSFANPRTGQILGADIMLEYSYITKRLLTKKLYDDLGLASEHSEGATASNPHACLACNCARQGIQLGQTMLRLQKSDRIEVDRLVKESLYYLALHEVGQDRHRQRDPHLREHLGHVEVGAGLEGDGQPVAAVVRALGAQREGPLHAADLLLDRGGDRVANERRRSGSPRSYQLPSTPKRGSGHHANPDRLRMSGQNLHRYDGCQQEPRRPRLPPRKPRRHHESPR